MPLEGTRRRVAALALEIFLLVLASLSLIALVLVSFLSDNFDEKKYDMYNSNATGAGRYSDMYSRPSDNFGKEYDNATRTAQYSDMFFTQVTAADFTFIVVWTTIYVWQAVWLLYGWSFLCRPSATRTIHISVYPSYSACCILLIGWLYLFQFFLSSVGLAVIVVINTIFYITLFVLTRSLSAKIPTASKYDVLLTRILVLNGISIFAVWTTIVIVVNLAIVLQYSSGLSASTAGTAALTLLAVGVFVYFLLENTVLDKYVRYVLVPYPVVIWGLIGIVAEHWGKPGETRNSVYTLVLLLAMVVLTVIRVVLFFLFRHFRPLKKRPATTDATNLVAV